MIKFPKRKTADGRSEIPSAGKKKKKALKISLCAVLVLAIAGGAIAFKRHSDKKKAQTSSSSGTSVVTRGNVVSSISGSGTVEPIEQRDIVPLVNGKISEAPFEEGDAVNEGDVLYKFEMTAAENAIKTARNSVKSAQNNVEKAKNTISNQSDKVANAKEDISQLTIYASASGKVSDLSAKQGDEVSGAVCKITNYKEQTATVPFSSAEISKIHIGDSATVEIEKYMMNVSGTVKRKYSSPSAGSDGSVVYNVEILVTDDVVLSEGVKAAATVHSSSGDISSASYGSVSYADPVTVNAEQKGKIQKLNVKNGDWVNKGEVIAVLTNSDLTDALKSANQSYNEAKMSLSDSNNSLENAQSSLEDKIEAAEDYVVTSPISGIVLSKDYTKGDTVSGNNATIMMVVADVSKMKFTIDVDELDIAKVELGQTVQVTADALENESITGVITSVSNSGTASNGVTNYPVEVTIDEPGDLMPGMNVSAEIVTDSAENVLCLPLTAVEHFGGKYYVTVVGEIEGGDRQPASGSQQPGGKGGGAPEQGDEKAASEDKSQSRDNSQSRGSSQSGSDSRLSGKSGNGKAPSAPSIKLSGKEERVEVTVGISNDDYYEIQSGVDEGAVVKNTLQSSGSSSTDMGMPGGGMFGGGGMSGGGMPGGGGNRGGGGGMPGGR